MKRTITAVLAIAMLVAIGCGPSYETAMENLRKEQERAGEIYCEWAEAVEAERVADENLSACWHDSLNLARAAFVSEGFDKDTDGLYEMIKIAIDDETSDAVFEEFVTELSKRSLNQRVIDALREARRMRSEYGSLYQKKHEAQKKVKSLQEAREVQRIRVENAKNFAATIAP